MTSPVSAIEAIEKLDDLLDRYFQIGVQQGLEHRAHDDREGSAQDACEEIRSVFLALARQAEALQRENAEKDARIAALMKGLTPFARIADMTRRNAAGTAVTVNVDRCRDARALLGGSENAE